MRRLRPVGLATWALLVVACEATTGTPAPSPIPAPARERHGDDPDRDLFSKMQDAIAISESAWSAEGYEQKLFGWRLPFQDARAHRLAPQPWKLENWTEKAPGHFEPRLGPEDKATFEVDDDGDGKIAAWEKHEEPLFDLALVNEEDDGLVWLKTRSIAPAAARRRLDLVARDYLGSLSGTATFAQMDIFGREKQRTRRLTTLIRDVSETKLGGHRAIAASADIADADDLRLNPRARLGQLRLIVARIGYLVPKRSPDEKSEWPEATLAGQPAWKKSGILVIGAFTSVGDDGKGSLLEALAGRLSFTATSVVVETPRPAEPAHPDTAGASAI